MKAPRLRAIRESRVLSQEELAELAGVSRLTVSNLERGSDGFPATIRKLARALGVDPGELVAADLAITKQSTV